MLGVNAALTNRLLQKQGHVGALYSIASQVYSRPPVEIIAKIAKAYASTARDFTARWGGGGGVGLLVSCVPMREQKKKNITKTRPCDIQQYFTAVKMFIVR